MKSTKTLVILCSIQIIRCAKFGKHHKTDFPNFGKLLNLFAWTTSEKDHCSCKVPGTAGPEAPCYGDKMQAFGWPGDPSGCHGDFPDSSDDPKLAKCLPQEQGQAVYILG